MLQNRQRVYTWTRHPVQFPDSGPASLRAPSSLRPSTALSDFTEGRSREMASLRPPSSSRTPSLRRSSAVFAPGSPDEFPFDFNADFARSDPCAFLSVGLWRRAKVASPTIDPRGCARSLEWVRPRLTRAQSDALEAPPFGRSPAIVRSTCNSKQLRRVLCEPKVILFFYFYFYFMFGSRSHRFA